MSLPNAAQLARLATKFKALHKSGDPVLIANVYDHLTATAVASLPDTKAIATASLAVALANGTQDDDLTLEQNLNAAKAVGAVALKHDLPASVDFQDGYGEKLSTGVAALLERGIVGINLEDYSREHGRLYSIDENVARIKTVLSTAAPLGVGDFVVNARCDVLLHGGELEEVKERGRAYLRAGATTVFVLGGKRAISADEIKDMVNAFDGKLNAGLAVTGGGAKRLKIEEFKALGVARLSVGPQLLFLAMEEVKRAASNIVLGTA